MEKLGIIITLRREFGRIYQKAFQNINGRPAIEILLDRLKSGFIRDIPVIVAIPESDPELELSGADIFRGSMAPLDRMIEAAEYYDFTDIVRITTDDILIDPFLLSRQIAFHLKNQLDYTYLGRCPTGVAGEIISTRALIDARQRAGADCEFISYYLKEPNLAYKEFYPPIEYQQIIRVCMDYPEDLILLRLIFSLLGDNFGTLDLINLYRNNPQIFTINNQPLLTVYTCFFNNADTIAEAVKSVLDNMGNSAFEYFLLDDGSTDLSFAAAMSAVEKYPDHIRSRVRVLTNGINKGLAYSGNRILDAARGKFILRVDADDIIYPDLPSVMLSQCSGSSAITAGYERDGKAYLEKHYHSGCSLLNTRIAQELRYKHGLAFAKGTEFLKTFEKFHKVHHIPESLWHYRTRKGSLTDKGEV